MFAHILFHSFSLLFSSLLLLSSLSSYSNAIPYPNQINDRNIGTKPKLKPFMFDNNVLDGQTVRIFCQLIDGSQPLSFQWFKNGQPLSSSSSSSSSLSFNHQPSSSTLATTPNLDIQTFHDYSSLAIYRVDRIRDSGNYTCLVSNSYGSDEHSSMLIVQEPPSFIEKPKDISIGLKQSTLIKCRASTPIQGHITKPIIRWNRLLFDGNQFNFNNNNGNIAIPDARREQISSGEQLHLTDIRVEDAGIYECVAENPHNRLTISHQFTITVNVPAYFKIKTEQLEVKRGETARIICETFGAKPVHIEWLKQQPHTGEFERLNLDYIPDAYSFPRYTALEKNFDSNFDLDNMNANMIETSLKSMPFVNNNRTLFELHINSVNSLDNGQYGCRAWNDYGEDVRRINLFVQDVPAMVRQIQLNQIWTSEASISWLSPDQIGNSPITQYILQYWKEIRLPNSTMISSGYRLHEIELSSTINNYILKNLTPGTSYAVRIIAVNQFGHGPSSELLRFQTEQESPAASPIDITVEPQGTSSLRIRWKAPPKSHWNGHLRGYYLGYRLISTKNTINNDNQQQSQQQNINNDISLISSSTLNNNQQPQQRAFKQIEFNGLAEDNYQEEYILTGLNRASVYGIILKCFNDAGEGPSSHEIIVSTSAKDPPPKPTLQLIETKENSALLKWSKDYDNEISHYILSYKEEKKNKWIEIELYKTKLANYDNDNEQNYNYNLNNLQRGTVYQLYLRSIGSDKISISEPSDVLTLRTDGEVPLVSMLNSNLDTQSAPQQPYHAIAAVPTAAFLPTLSTYQQSSSSSSQQQVPPYFRIGFIVPVAIAIVVITIACVGAYVYIRIDDRNQQIKLYNAATTIAGTNTANLHVGTLAVGPGKRFQYISPAHSSAKLLLNNSLTPSSLNSSNGLRDTSCAQSLVSEESSLSFRYSDSSSDKGRPLLARPPIVPSGVVWAQQQSPIPEEDEAIVDIDSSAYETLPFQKNGQFQSTPLTSFSNQQPQMTNSSNHSQTSTAKSPSFPPPPPPLPGAIYKSSPLNRPNNNATNDNNVFCHVDVHHTQSSCGTTSDANNSDSYDDFRFFSRV